MKLSLITQDEVKRLTTRELVSLHYRIHQLYVLAKKRKQKDFVTFLVNTHKIVVDELQRRGTNHRSPITEILNVIIQGG